MPYTIDLGASLTPLLTRLDRSPDFDTLNVLEIETYRSALIARFGVPPEGCRFTIIPNHHDFGCYRTLGLRVMSEDDATVADYAETVEEGLATWIEAGFRAPVRYDGAAPVVEHADPAGIVTAALMTTRPATDGTFPVPGFAVLHANLAAAFPAEAAAARARIAALA